MNLDPVVSSIPMNLDPDEVVGPFLKNKKYTFVQTVRGPSVRGSYFIIRRYNNKRTAIQYPNVEVYFVDIDYMPGPPGPNQQLQYFKNVVIVYNINERVGRLNFNQTIQTIKNMPPEANINRRNRRSSKLRKISRRSKSYRRRKTNRRN
jgi:hypothetical protein